jgi:hypothetical protein
LSPTSTRSQSSVPDAKFLALVALWAGDQTGAMLGFVWTAYDSMLENIPFVDGRDLERSITQLLEPRIRNAMTGDEPYYVQHGPYEHETMLAPPAQPPAYDLAFVLRAEERVMWPIEAKVLETPNQVAAYERDVREEFLKCRYAPFSNAGAMLAYLLCGSAEDAFAAIEKKLGCSLKQSEVFSDRAHRTSDHQRTVPIAKPYPKSFSCHHLVMAFLTLVRTTKSDESAGAPA